MNEDMQAGRVRLPRQRGPKFEPVPTKRCNACKLDVPVDQFDRRVNGGQGLAGVCKPCMAHRYANETFGCNRCGERLPGSAFFPGNQGAAIRQPCKRCRSSAKEAATRISQIERGRSPYHLLSAVDGDGRTATCRECGPTHIYATGSKQGCGWRCGTRSDELSGIWYDTRAEIVGKNASARWHRIRDVRGFEMRGTCSLCGDTPVRWLQAAGHFVCAGPSIKRRHADVERRRKRLAIYGLTMDDYERMNEDQQGRCAICDGVQVRADSDGSLVVDHDHITGSVRALLCNKCNAGLGQFGDDPALLLAAAEYLREHSRS